MAGLSKIEWTDASWNPIVGCSILTPGCTNCYAMKMAARIESMKRSHYDGTTKKVNGNAVWTGKLALALEYVLLAPLKRKKPTTYFVNSMGDLFHEDAPDEWIDKVFAVMALAPQHTFQILTKRAERMRDYFAKPTNIDGFASSAHYRVGCKTALMALNASAPYLGNGGAGTWPLPNVWLGVSTERQQEADERIPHLLQTPAAVRFISAEPLLGPIDLMMLKSGDKVYDAMQGCIGTRVGDGEYDGAQSCAKLDWVIVGGESGPDARPMNPYWARWLREQCRLAGAAFFFKQWGGWKEWSDSDFSSEEAESLELQNRYEYFQAHSGDAQIHMRRVGKKAAGRQLDGIEHNGMPNLAAKPLPGSAGKAELSKVSA